MADLYLHADDEAALAAALPMLRCLDEDGAETWIVGGPFHALDAGFVVEGSEGYHANLRLLDGHPETSAIQAACEPFLVFPMTPQRGFAGGPIALPIPDVISDRQFAQALAKQGVITKDEALDFVRIGALPSTLRQAIDAIPDPDLRFDAEMEVSGATTFVFGHPTTQGLALALGWSEDQLAALWRFAASLS